MSYLTQTPLSFDPEVPLESLDQPGGWRLFIYLEQVKKL